MVDFYCCSTPEEAAAHEVEHKALMDKRASAAQCLTDLGIAKERLAMFDERALAIVDELRAAGDAISCLLQADDEGGDGEMSIGSEGVLGTQRAIGRIEDPPTATTALYRVVNGIRGMRKQRDAALVGLKDIGIEDYDFTCSCCGAPLGISVERDEYGDRQTFSSCKRVVAGVDVFMQYKCGSPGGSCEHCSDHPQRGCFWCQLRLCMIESRGHA